MAPLHSRQSQKSGDVTSLGYKGQEFSDTLPGLGASATRAAGEAIHLSADGRKERSNFSDDLSEVYARLYPFDPMPAVIACMAAPRGLKGGKRCKSLLCSRCHSQNQAAFARRLRKDLAGAKGRLENLKFLTLTASHGRRETLVESMTAIRSSWAKARSGPQYNRLRETHGLCGIVSVFELTRNDNGWHLHLHCVLMAENSLDANHCLSVLQDRYENELRRIGRNGPRAWEHSDIDDVDRLITYLTKDWRRTSHDGETPLHMLHRAKKGDVVAASLYFEAVAALKGKKRGYVHNFLRQTLSIRAGCPDTGSDS